MKRHGFKIIIFCASLIVGCFIALNADLSAVSSSSVLNAKEYQEAVEEKLQLYNEVSDLKKSNQEILNKVIGYKYTDENQQALADDMKEELSKNGLLTGLTEVQGAGVVVTVKDGVMGDNNEENKLKTFHDYDMINLLNEFKKCEVEAISVNNYRISALTGVVCHGSFLQFQDQSVVYGPFQISLIGDPDTLKITLLKDGSYIKKLRSRGISVTLEKVDNITMPAAKESNIKYAKEYIK
ncbi:MAG: DUF881 domain-containing protein [Clostridium sp.]